MFLTSCDLLHFKFGDGFSSCRMGFLRCPKFSGMVFQYNSTVFVTLMRGETPAFLLSYVLPE